MRRGIYRLCLVALAAAVLPGAARAQTAAITIPTSTLNVSEAGSSQANSHTVVLATAPTGEVAVALSVTPAGHDLTLTPATLTFTTANWNIPQGVAVGAGVDADNTDDTATITHTANGGGYNGVTADRSVMIDDFGAVTFGFERSSFTVQEDAVQFEVCAVLATPSPSTGIGDIQFGLTSSPSDGTATGGADYTAVSNPFIFLRDAARRDCFSMEVINDSVAESDETFTLTLTLQSGSVVPSGFPIVAGGQASTTVTIAANDQPVTLSVAAPGADLTEGAAADFAVSFPEAITTTGAVMVDWDISFPSASAMVNPAAEADFATRSGTATIPMGESSVNVAITAADDNLNEAAETFTVTLSNPRGGGEIAAPALHATPTAEAAIAASDPITVSLLPPLDANLVATGIQVNEGSSAEFTAMLSGLSAGDVTAAITATASGGASNADLEPGTPASVVIPAGVTSATFALSIARDTEDETGEMFVVALGTPGAGFAGAGAGTVTLGATVEQTILLMDVAHIFAISGDVALVEGATATYTVTRTGPDIAGGASIVIRWTYAAGATNPAAAADFANGVAPAGGMLTFTGAQTSATFTIATAEDALEEPDETFTLGLAAGGSVLSSNGGVGLAAGIGVTIGESDQPITLSVAAPGSALTEGTAADFAVSFPEMVTTTEAVMVDWAISFPAASDMAVPAEAADFAAAMRSGTATIPAGMSSVNVSITAAADMLSESAEHFSVRLSNPRGGGAIAAPALHATPAAEASIAESDPVTISIAGPGAAVSEGGTADFTLSLAPSGVSSAGNLCVAFSTAVSQQTSADGANTAANADIAVSDCSGSAVAVNAAGVASGGFEIPAGSNSATLSIPVRFDDLDEGTTDETLTVTLTGVTPATGTGMTSLASAPGNAASAPLMNVNALRALSVAATTATAEEGGDLVFTVTVSGAAVTEAFDVAWSLADAGSADAEDYTGASSGTLNFGVSSATTQAQMITFGTVDDALSEGAETLVLVLADPCSGDPCAVGGRPPGAAAAAPSLQITTAMATATIAESDRPVTLSVEPTSLGTFFGEGSEHSFFVSFTEPIITTEAVEVDWEIEFSDASEDDLAAGMLSGTLSIPAGEDRTTLRITTLDDNLNEPSERFSVRLSNPRGGGAIAAPVLHGTAVSAEALIAASDPADMRIAGPGAAAREGGTADFTLSLVTRFTGVAITSGRDSCVAFSTEVSQQTSADGANTADNADIAVSDCDGNAVAVNAAGVASGGFRFPTGVSSATLSIPVRFDDLDEGATDETLTVTLTGVTGAGSVSTASAPNDSASAQLMNVNALRMLSVAATTATAEEGGDLVFTATVSGAPVTEAFGVAWSLDDAGSADAEDYAGASSGTLNFDISSQMTQTQEVTIRTVDDALSEDAETLVLVLADPCTSDPCAVGGGSSGVRTITLATATATATIAESDRPVTLSVAGPVGALTEGAAADFAVSFAEMVTTTEAVMVDWAVSFPAASAMVVPAEAADFAAEMRSGTAEIPAGASTANISITAAADMLNESAETFSVRLSNPRGGGAIAAPMLPETPTAEASIAASDPVTVRIAGPGAAASEGGTADFALSLALSDGTAAASGGDLCVAFTTAVSQQPSADGANTPDNADIAVSDCTGAAVSVAADGSANGVFRFPAGSAGTTLPIPVRLDILNEGATPEVLTVTLTGITPAAGAGMAGVSAVPGEETASASLMNVNTLRALSLDATTATAEEGGDLVFTATVTGAPVTEAFGVAWSLAGSAEAGDYTGASSGTLSFGVSGERIQTRTLTFGAVDDALNEGAETLILSLDDPCTSAPCNTGGRPASAGTTAPTLHLATATDTATIAASDPITVFITEEPSQTTLARGIGGVSQRTFVPGDSVTYRLSFGTTTVSGSVVQIVTTTHLMIPLILTNAASGMTRSIPVPVQPGAQSVTQVVSAETLAALAGTSGTPQIAPSVGAVAVTDASGNALSGPSAPVAQAGTAADLRTQPDSPDSLSPPDPAPGAPDSSVNPAPRRYTQWDMTVAPQESAAQAPEGASYTVTFSLRGNAADLSPRGLAFTWQIAPRAAADGGEEADAEDFAFSTGAGCTESTTIAGACGSFPSGEVVFNAGDASQTLSIAILDDDGMVPEGTTPEGFTLSFGAIAGADVGRATLAGEPAASSSPAALQVDIPALRAFLGIEDAVGQEGGTAQFVLTLGDFSGGGATTDNVVVEYSVGAAGDTAVRGDSAGVAGADYVSAETGRIEIPTGQGSTAIEIPLLLDGRLEPRERFTVTITSATGGGGNIRLADATGATQSQITAVGIIGDDADQEPRREERVGTLVAALDRQTAFLATDAISARLSRQQTAAAPAQLSIANRNLLAASKATAANGGSARGAGGGAEVSAGAAQRAAPDIGLALYGAGGLGGAAATSGASLRGGHAGGYAGGGAGGADAFGGLGAGLAGGANMGSRTALPNLAQLLRGSRFTFAATNWTSGLSNLADGVQFWGSGGFADIDGDPQSGGDGLSYDGDNFAFFAGADRPVGQNLLAGFALGWAAGDLDFTDRDGDFQMQGTLSNDTISVHPYLGWQVTPTLNTWLVLGFGLGSVDISENEGSGAGRISRALNGGDSTMLMFSAGFSEHRQFAAADLKLRFAVTRVRSDVDSARFDDGALLPSARGRSIRVGGEAELSRRFAFANGIALRPFGSLRARFDSTGSTDAAARRGIEDAFDWGAGLQADWPALGLDGRFAFTRQLNETGRDEQRISATVNFDPGAKDRGLSVAVQSALAQSRTHTLGSAFGAGASANSAFGNTFGAGAGGAFGASASSALGAGANGALGGGAGATQSLSGEIAYGMAFRLRQIGRSGLLTPYARFALGHANTRWAAGLRLAELRSALQVGLEAALDRNSRNPANSTATTTTTTTGSSYDLLLTGRLRF